MSRVDELSRLPGDLRLRRAWPRSPEHLHLEYRDPGGALVPAQWMRDVDELRRVARRTRRASGIDVPVIEFGGGAVCLQYRGADRRLTALAPLLEDDSIRLISHRPERRAVVSQASRFGKIVRTDRVDQLIDPLNQVTRTTGNFVIPQISAVDRALGLVWQHTIEGVGPFETDDPAPVFSTVGTALRAFHDQHAWDTLGTHDGKAESALLATTLDRTRAHDPEIADRIAADLERVQRALAAGAPATAVLHRDLHDKQLIVQPGGEIALIDLDTIALGEPELDVANLVAHLELRGLQQAGDASAFESCRETFVESYGAVKSDRFEAYLDATRLRLALVYSMRPRWRGLAGRLQELVHQPCPD